MRSRGEASFTNLPNFAAKLYDHLTRTPSLQTQVEEIALDLAARIGDFGRLLDVGSGPGWLLLKLHRLNPTLALYGLDIAGSMVDVARQNLAGLHVDLRQGSIRATNYDPAFFDLITCTGSFYLWDQPVDCLEEIYRLLKPDCSAYLYETHRDFQPQEFQQALRLNLRAEGPLRRLLLPFILKKQLKMTYCPAEIVHLLEQTRFAPHYSLDKITLTGLPIWLRLRLTRPAHSLTQTP
ncbi:MAG: methyltransferase domain-containing protein [Chloroflexota bacterium]